SVYRDCLEQMKRALQKEKLDAEDYSLLREAEVQSILVPASKATYSFFFIRQVAEERCAHDERLPDNLHLAFRGQEPEFAEDLQPRVVADVETVPTENTGLTVRSVANCDNLPPATEIAVHLQPLNRIHALASLAFYQPLQCLRSHFGELAV